MSFATRLKMACISGAGYFILRLLFSTVRWKRNDVAALPDGGPIYIFAIWHGRVLMTPFIYLCCYRKKTRRPFCVLVSRHFDGQLIGAMLRLARMQTVSGSSTRGGAAGMLGLIRAIKSGSDAAIMPDGPKGPRHEVKAGTIKTAAETGAAIVPMTIGVKRYWEFKSWDRMQLPKPFTEGVVILGEPIAVPSNLRDEDIQQWRDLLKEKMLLGVQEADGYEYA